MGRTSTTKRQKSESSGEQRADAFQPREGKAPTREAGSRVHLLGPGIICDTEPRGHSTPQGRSPLEIVVDATDGFIPLWDKNMILRWRFRTSSLDYFQNPAAAKAEIQKLFAEAVLAWVPAAPVKFTMDDDLWDFEIVMRSADECNGNGCVLASAFFPDSGRQKLTMYPKLFTQSREERVDTFIHEIGHIFGLRHFFANISETTWPSEIFGTHSKFSIMNYGSLSQLTPDDKNDLGRLYQLAWAGTLTQINGTRIRFVKPYSTLATAPDNVLAVGQVPTVFQPASRAAYTGGL
jgi:hypothetical protein